MGTELAPLVEDGTQQSSEVDKDAPREVLPESVWEDEATLDSLLDLTEDVELPEGTSVQVSAKVKGPQPQIRML